ncbi:putative quinol monooxygenase [Chryseobacterium aquifrigidense]|uniref:Quinol monooxygenase YgiN n=1 Tax=Chryseobacterium aquifrigidense TaxID=558021 RepID=A0A543EHQ9_9FLAO|nr:antibiotic biosynthesis monooxygenase family protein [Chryseobacterium aquifrigidense]TQM21086.1 quinol monooxygenase YgiN [Chryseobacterium aquifrigidense]
MEQFTLAIKFTAKPDNYEQFKKALADLFETVSEQENFVQATIHQNIQKAEEFFVYEVWNEDIEHFMNVTLKQPYVLEWEQLLLDLEIQREPSVYQSFAKFKK